MKPGQKQCFGIIIGTRAYFNSELARDVRKHLLQTLEAEGYDYVILPEDATPTGSSSIETRADGMQCAALFRAHRDRISGIIVSLPNFGFEIGIINAISAAELNVPVLVQACDDENDKVDLDSRRDAFCGKISVCNNLYQYGIPFTDTTLHTYSIYSPLLVKDLHRFAGICRVVNGLRHSRIGQIGTRPVGFNTCRASEKLLQQSGITVVPVDLSEILEAARRTADHDPLLLRKMEEIRAYAHVPESYSAKLPLQAKFGLAVEQWMDANEVDAVAIQCWDSLEQNYGCAPCITMSMLGDRLIPAACETDIAGAVSMYALTLASGKASALLDWNNNFAEDRNKCVCTHCGNFPRSFVQGNLKLGPLGVLGRTLGKVNTFGAVYAKVAQGDFTFFRISTDDTRGCIKSYLGEGIITDEPYGMDGCIAVTRVNNLQKLMKHICRNGFEHHVAMCRGQVKDILQDALENYLGWELYVHTGSMGG
jgi:L-fucose isomerase-like protein